MAKLGAVLRASAKSDPGSTHFQSMKREYLLTAKKLLEVSKLVSSQGVNDVIDVLKKTPPGGSADQKIAAADKIKTIAFRFGSLEKAHDLTTIQSMLPSKDDYR